MTSGELIELAAFVSAKAPLLIDCGQGLRPDAIARYWSAAKCRQQRWALALKQVSVSLGEPQSNPQTTGTSVPCPAHRRAVAPFTLLREIFESEVLTRVWTAVMALRDRRHKISDAEPVARNVFMGHLETRHRALKLLVSGPGVNSEEAVDLNRLRRRAERWNDLLIGNLLSHGDPSLEFAFDADLAAEFGGDFQLHAFPSQRRMAWSIVMASLKSGLAAGVRPASPNEDLNQQIGAAVLGCFGDDAFDSLGLPRSLWAVRMMHSADSAHGLIEQIFATEPLPCRRGPDFIIRR